MKGQSDRSEAIRQGIEVRLSATSSKTDRGSPAGEQEAWRGAWSDALRCTSLGWDLALPIVGGALLGHALDGRFQTGAVLTVVLLFLGVAAGYANVVRLLQEEIQLDSQRRQRDESA